MGTEGSELEPLGFSTCVDSGGASSGVVSLVGVLGCLTVRKGSTFSARCILCSLTLAGLEPRCARRPPGVRRTPREINVPRAPQSQRACGIELRGDIACNARKNCTSDII